MFKFIYPQKDTFISNHPRLLNRNFGIDEVLEIEQRKILDDTNSSYANINSRGLIQFDLSAVSQSIASGEITNPKFFLELFTVEAIETPAEYTIRVNPVSQSWDVGVGRLYDDNTTDGASWNYRTSVLELWSGSLSASLAEAGISGSISASIFEAEFLKNNGGGAWYDTIISESFGKASSSLNITNINEGDSFYVTSSDGEIYTFKTSQSIQTIQHGQASASIDFGLIHNFDRFCVSASSKCCINVVLPNTPDDCNGEFFVGWSGSSLPPTESKAVIQFTKETLKPEKEFELYDAFNDVTWNLRATSNPNIPDSDYCNLRFFDASGTLCNRVTNLSNEINGLPNLYINSSISQSFETSQSVDVTTTSSISITTSSSVSASVSQSFTATVTSNVSSSIYYILTASCDYDFSQSFSSSYSEVYSSSISSSISASVSQSFISYFTTSLSQSFEYQYTSSYNQFLILESVDMGSAGNDFYLWDKDDVTVSSSFGPCADIVIKDDSWGRRLVYSTSNPCGSNGKWAESEEQELLSSFETKTVIKNVNFLHSGSGVGKKQRFDLLLNEFYNLTGSCGFSVTSSGYNITFTADVSGSVGNGYYFESGSTFTQSFDGGYTSSITTQSADDVTNNIFFFDRVSGSLSGSLEKLVDKINSTLTFVDASSSVSASVSIIHLTADSVGLIGEQIGFQSGSTQITLSGSKQLTSISSDATQSFRFESSDINVDVTHIVNSWLTGVIENDGFIIRNALEGDDRDYGKLRFYSQNTNTIYIPRLTVKWDNQIFSTGSLDEVNLDNENVVYVKNLKETYKSDEVVKFRILARDRYPQKTFTNTGQRFITTKYLSSNTVFAIQDAESEEFLIPFDDQYTKVSCDSDGPFFTLDMNSLPQERYFRLLFKTSKNGVTTIFKEKGIFKVTR